MNPDSDSGSESESTTHPPSLLATFCLLAVNINVVEMIHSNYGVVIIIAGLVSSHSHLYGNAKPAWPGLRTHPTQAGLGGTLSLSPRSSDLPSSPETRNEKHHTTGPGCRGDGFHHPLSSIRGDRTGSEGTYRAPWRVPWVPWRGGECVVV